VEWSELDLPGRGGYVYGAQMWWMPFSGQTNHPGNYQYLASVEGTVVDGAVHAGAVKGVAPPVSRAPVAHAPARRVLPQVPIRQRATTKVRAGHPFAYAIVVAFPNGKIYSDNYKSRFVCRAWVLFHHGRKAHHLRVGIARFILKQNGHHLAEACAWRLPRHFRWHHHRIRVRGKHVIYTIHYHINNVGNASTVFQRKARRP
jgi:hypothetical protein